MQRLLSLCQASLPIALLCCLTQEATAADFSFQKAANALSSRIVLPVVTDINNDGWPETWGNTNINGVLSPLSSATTGLDSLFVPTNSTEVFQLSDARLADFNGDSLPDVITQGYGSLNYDVRARMFMNNGLGGFTENSSFAQQNFNGKGEALVIADFNNDGAPDVLLPYYTFNCTPSGVTDPNCPNAPQSYLLMNDGNGNFTEVADAAGVALRDPRTGGLAVHTQPEGVQAADLNDDGLIDLYINGKVLINSGLQSFNDTATSRTLTIPKFEACNCGIPVPTDDRRSEEGAKFLDWNNDGKLDLVLHHWNTGPTIFENDGEAPIEGGANAPLTVHFSARKWTTDSPTACNTDATSIGCRRQFHDPATPAATLPFQDSFGINAFDIDNDGWEDIYAPGSVNPPRACPAGSGVPCPVYPNRFFRNTGTGMELVNAGDLSPVSQPGNIAFADIDKDNRVDAIHSLQKSYYLNKTTGGNAFTINVVGADGAQNQHGRVVRILLPKAGCSFAQPGCTLTRVVDGGSGYHSQNEYPLLIGSTFIGARHQVNVLFPNLQGDGTVEVKFDIFPGQAATVFGPSSSEPNGSATVAGTTVTPPPGSATPTPLPPTATSTPTTTSTPVPTATSTPVPTATPTPQPTATSTPIPTATPTPRPTATSTPVPTATPTPRPTATSTPVPTATPTPRPTATSTPVPTATPTPIPTATSTPVPTATPTPIPTATSTPLPTATPTLLPTATSTPVPTATPVPTPTAAPAPVAFTSAITSVRTSGCLEIASSSTSDFATVQTNTCRARTNQSLTLAPSSSAPDAYTMAFRHSGKCLESSSSLFFGTVLRQRACSGPAAQLFRLRPVANQRNVYNVVSGNLGLCVAVNSSSSGSSRRAVLSTCNSSSTSQQWRIQLP